MSNARLRCLALFTVLALAVSTSLTQAAIVDFESLAVGTQFGGGFGNAPGDLVFTEDGVGVPCRQFHERRIRGVQQRRDWRIHRRFVPHHPGYH